MHPWCPCCSKSALKSCFCWSKVHPRVLILFGKQWYSMDWEQNALELIHFSLQIPLECTCTADLCPKLFETLFSIGKLLYHRASLELRMPEMSVNISFPVVQNPPADAHFLRNHYHVMPCSCCLPARGWFHSMLWVAGGSMCERMFVTASAVTAIACPPGQWSYLICLA